MGSRWGVLRGAVGDGGFGTGYAQRPVPIRRKPCEKCATETLHKGYKCLICGSIIKFKFGMKKHQKMNMRFKLRMDRITKRTNNDRRAAYHAAAEASRKMFEGK